MGCCVRSGKNATNKAFKSDSQRLAVSLRSSIAKRRSHLNAALCNSGKFRGSIFWISPAIRFELSANELFYPKIRGLLKP